MKALAINTLPRVSEGFVAFSCLRSSSLWEGRELGGVRGAGSGDAGGAAACPWSTARSTVEPCSAYRCLSRLIRLFAQEEGEVSAAGSWSQGWGADGHGDDAGPLQPLASSTPGNPKYHQDLPAAHTQLPACPVCPGDAPAQGREPRSTPAGRARPVKGKHVYSSSPIITALIQQSITTYKAPKHVLRVNYTLKDLS